MGFFKSIVKCLSACFKGDKRSARPEIPEEEEALPTRMVIPDTNEEAIPGPHQPWLYPSSPYQVPRPSRTKKPRRQRLSSSCYSDVDPSPSLGGDSLPRWRGNQDRFTREWTGTTGNPYLSVAEVEAEDQAFYAQFQQGPYGTRGSCVG